MSKYSDSELREAVLCWVAWNTSPMPSRSDARVLDRFGQEKGTALLVEIKRSQDDFYLSDAHLVASDLKDMARRCAEDFRRKRPGVAEDVVNAFVWCYTFDYK